MNSALQILMSIIAVSILVVAHELGHYLSARAFGMRVEKFSIGLGKPIFRFQRPGSPTVFQICWIPFLAYVQIAGMNPFDEEVDQKDPEIFPNKSVVARIVTILGGSFANYLVAVVVAFGMAITVGIVPLKVKISSVEVGSPAELSGIKVGDVVVEANRKPIDFIEEMIRETKDRAGKKTEYVVSRNGTLHTITVIPRMRDVGKGEKRATIGIQGQGIEVQSVGEALETALRYPVYITQATIMGLGNMIKERSTEGMVGVVGMVDAGTEHAKGGVMGMLFFLISVSVGVGFANLLPFPAADGGRLLFLLYELVTRRKPNAKVEAMIHYVGLIFILVMMVGLTYRDIKNWGKRGEPPQKKTTQH